MRKLAVDLSFPRVFKKTVSLLLLTVLMYVSNVPDAYANYFHAVSVEYLYSGMEEVVHLTLKVPRGSASGGVYNLVLHVLERDNEGHITLSSVVGYPVFSHWYSEQCEIYPIGTEVEGGYVYYQYAFLIKVKDFNKNFPNGNYSVWFNVWDDGYKIADFGLQLIEDQDVGISGFFKRLIRSVSGLLGNIRRFLQFMWSWFADGISYERLVPEFLKEFFDFIKDIFYLIPQIISALVLTFTAFLNILIRFVQIIISVYESVLNCQVVESLVVDTRVFGKPFFVNVNLSMFQSFRGIINLLFIFYGVMHSYKILVDIEK